MNIQTIHSPKTFSNTSVSWIARNKHLLKSSQHCKYCMYTLQIWQNEYSLYATFNTNKSLKSIRHELIIWPIIYCESFIKNRIWSSNYAPKLLWMHLEPETLVFECLNQSTDICNGIRFYLCFHIFTGAGLKIVLISSVWQNNQCRTWTHKLGKYSLISYRDVI